MTAAHLKRMKETDLRILRPLKSGHKGVHGASEEGANPKVRDLKK